jgi:DNA-binding XRE family transcriptional regulator
LSWTDIRGQYTYFHPTLPQENSGVYRCTVPGFPITREQCRAARALLYWSQPKLAEATGITRETIANFERAARTPRRKNLTAIRTALESAGVVFIPGTATSGPGVHLRDPLKT